MKKIFEQQNLWRKSGYSFSEEKYIKRSVFEKLKEDIKKKEITVIVGSRQVGKTFLMKKILEYLIKQNMKKLNFKKELL